MWVVKYGVLQFFSWPERRVPLATVYERALDRIQIMDTTGYDAVWLAEHHFSGYSVCPSVHMMGTHVASLTKNLRIGTAVSLATFYHPLRLAEEVALLDNLTGGRVNWGAGRGFDRKEFTAFGVAPEESYPRFQEHVDIVLQAWTQERLTYHGQFHNFEDIEVLPRPFQDPHPPVWLASSSPDAIAWAAGRGFNIMMDPHSPHGGIAEKFTRYHRILKENNHPADGRDIPMARMIAVDDTLEKAEAVARNGAEWVFKSYSNPKLKPVRKYDPSRDNILTDPTIDPIQRYLDEVVIHGTPEKVIDDLQRLQTEMHLTYFLAAPLSHKSFMLLTEKVMPYL